MDWLEGKLKYSNEPSLRSRAEDIINTHEDIIEGYIGESFKWKVVDTRNYLTHYDEELKNRKKDGIELYDLCRKLETVIEISVLDHIGAIDKEIKMDV